MESGDGCGCRGRDGCGDADRDKCACGLADCGKEDIEGEVTGEITGFIDGEPFTVYTMISQEEGWEEGLSSASWNPRLNEYSVDILGYREKQTDRRGLVTLHLRFDEHFNPLADDSRATYYESAVTLYDLPYGSEQVTSVERLDEDTIKVSGTFGGTGTEEWTLETKEITDGKFSIDQISRFTGF